MVKDEKIDVKIAVNKEEAAWQTELKTAEESIASMRRAILINDALIKLCHVKIRDEKAKFK